MGLGLGLWLGLGFGLGFGFGSGSGSGLGSGLGHLGGEAEEANDGARCGHQPLLGCAVCRAEVEHLG